MYIFMNNRYQRQSYSYNEDNAFLHEQSLCAQLPKTKDRTWDSHAWSLLERRREIHRKPLRADSNFHGNKFLVY